MKIFCIFFIAAVTVWQGVAGAADEGVLSGYLVLGDDTKCLGTDGVSVGSPTSTSQTDLASVCIKLYLVEGIATQMYKILKLADQTMKLKLADMAAPAFVTDGSDTEVQFSDESDLLTAATAGSVGSITTKAGAFIIQISGATVTDAACLTATPDYLNTGCGSIKWYFIAADCEVSDCVTCNVDALKCDSCTDGTHVVNSDNDACQECDAAMPDCTTCSDTTGTAICSACGATKTLDSAGTSCVDCTVDNCDNCDTDLATCDTCADGYNKEGDTCEEEATTTESRGSALTTTIILTVLAALVALKSLIYI